MNFIKILLILFIMLFSKIITGSNDMDFSIYQPCEGNGSMCSPYILANGLITLETPNKFREFLRKNEKDLYFPIIYFNSNGGNLQGGMEPARIIREKILILI